MTKDEFKEIHEAWMELMVIFDEIDALNDPAGIREKAGPGILLHTGHQPIK